MENPKYIFLFTRGGNNAYKSHYQQLLSSTRLSLDTHEVARDGHYCHIRMTK